MITKLSIDIDMSSNEHIQKILNDIIKVLNEQENINFKINNTSHSINFEKLYLKFPNYKSLKYFDKFNEYYNVFAILENKFDKINSDLSNGYITVDKTITDHNSCNYTFNFY